jgi:hypothetical protein
LIAGRGQAAARHDLDNPTCLLERQVEPAGLGRPGQPVEALAGEQAEVRCRDGLPGVDQRGRGEQHLISDPGGSGDDHVGAGHGSIVPAGRGAGSQLAASRSPADGGIVKR